MSQGPWPYGAAERVLLVVLDGLGVGALPGAGRPDLQGAHSLRNAATSARWPRVPFLASIGLLAAAGLDPAGPSGPAAWGRTKQMSPFNESYAAHWELAGHVATQGNGHPAGLDPRLLRRLERELGMPVLGNVGCYPKLSDLPGEIIRQHLATGFPILLVQAEVEPVSVLAVYAHSQTMRADQLFGLVAATAPRLTDFPLRGRLCARSFDLNDVGAPVVRDERLDLPFFVPPSTALADAITASGRTVMATGKVGGLFCGHGFTRCYDQWGDERILENTMDALRATPAGLVWANFNTLSRPAGACRDAAGWISALERYDSYLAQLQGQLGDDDLMIVTGDHGVDPTLTGEHTLEWTPLLVTGRRLARQVDLSCRSHADVAASIADLWRLPLTTGGRSFLAELARTGTGERRALTLPPPR